MVIRNARRVCINKYLAWVVNRLSAYYMFMNKLYMSYKLIDTESSERRDLEKE